MTFSSADRKRPSRSPVFSFNQPTSFRKTGCSIRKSSRNRICEPSSKSLAIRIGASGPPRWMECRIPCRRTAPRVAMAPITAALQNALRRCMAARVIPTTSIATVGKHQKRAAHTTSLFPISASYTQRAARHARDYRGSAASDRLHRSRNPELDIVIPKIGDYEKEGLEGIFVPLTWRLSLLQAKSTARKGKAPPFNLCAAFFGTGRGGGPTQDYRNPVRLDQALRVPRHREATPATVLVASTSQEEARKACDEGVIWRAQLLDCEPYWPALRRHPAWSGECPEKSKVLAKAKEAYQFRPRTYETATTISAIATHTSAPTFSFGAEEREDDSYQVVGRKRLRGRPTNVAAAQRQALLDPQQTSINFETPRVRFASLVVSGVDTTALPPRAPEPATGPTPTAAANPAVTATPNQRDAEGDTTMDSITVAGDENKNFTLEHRRKQANTGSSGTPKPRRIGAACGSQRRTSEGKAADSSFGPYTTPPAGENVPRALQGRPRPSHPAVLAGDFNLKNPLWDGFGRYDRKSEDLLQLGSLWDLTIRTPRGATTRAPQGRQRELPRGDSEAARQPSTTSGLRKTSKQYTTGKSVVESQTTTHKCSRSGKGMGRGQPNRMAGPGRRWTGRGLVEWLTWVAKESTPRKKASCGYSSPWWTVEVQQAAREARRAERLAKETRAGYCWEELSERLRDLSRTTREARTRAWRNNLQEASEAKKPDQIWSLERWARLRSFLPPEPPRLPAFKDSSGQVTAETHDQKASALAEGFFPDPLANLTDVEDQAFLGDWNRGFDVSQAVTPTEIAKAIGGASPWKASGEDLLPMGLLKACGMPLAEVLAVLATRCLELGWFPDRFKKAKTIVLPKPGKAPPVYQTPGGYRPIALLPTLGKVIESVVARKVTQAAEVNGLLPDEQMGNWAHRSTELAVRLVVAQVQEAWRQKATLRELGFPRWLVLWTRDWLTGREATLLFDGKMAAPTAIRAGVPQGSHLSTVLFILYISSLYKQLKDEHPHLAITGFADDTNLLVFGRNPEANGRQLEAAWETCIRWADSRGMKFAPEKSELIHFNKGRRQWTEQVNLANPGGGTSPVKPEESARFLGVWLDWKLNWKAHLVAVEKKLRTQSYALSRIVAKTRGMGLAKVREVYTKCIRSALAYGASSFYIPTDVGGEPAKKGITKTLGKAQNKSLRIVAGAFKSTPIRNLETEAWVPPLDLYLNKRLADFENRLQRPDLDDGQGGKKTAASVVLTACRKIQQRLSSERGNRSRPRTLGPQGPTAVERAAGTVMRWTGGIVDTNRVVEEAWKARWLKERDGRAIGRPADDFDHQEETLFPNETLRRHDGLSKAKSSLLIQIRTGAIGLRDFLFTRGVPEVLTPACECGVWPHR
ncbi:hypothetical protein CHGG_02695 [Chaetomium globosum CBS 148.51]|uniref:Reverse transcriptase domain-containing protein n=1 Tax=Chaetomium globosum (strain ATCC 6205 / CBS 148.51 / DSM 1962 / NBRC 6347 / NRRL 1970) TaxID=306901 RepID=Q2HAQ9_CHAGB|nr:uncharacterized protein CHGG_02695 [Chaetomium globosum CBS 148.51]EAQ90760.1 hypothetical protein CHGG_02695 [Chaetomium globosum CBS 148.51]